MNFWKNRYTYLQLMEEFISTKIDGVEFKLEFYRLMRVDRDNPKNQQEDHGKPYELESVLSRVFTACDVFEPNSEDRLEYEYDEAELKDFVRNILSENRELFI